MIGLNVFKLMHYKYSVPFVMVSFIKIAVTFLYPHPRTCLLICREWGKEKRQREGEREVNIRKKHRLLASGVHPDLELNLQPRHMP